MANPMGAFADAQFWGDVASGMQDYGQDFYRILQEYGSIPGQADNIAERQFGAGYARDSSSKNAFRHALGTGMIQDKLATSPVISEPVAKAIASMAGFGWELLAPTKLITNPKQRLDAQHDLNANYLGARTASETNSQADLIRALEGMARNSVKEAPPSWYLPSPGYMTRTAK